jgi:hypothetical protein
MDKNLERLITEFQSRVRDAVALMYRSGMMMPHSSFAWSRADIPETGFLDGGIKYLKHGAGCEVQLETGPVDFDFGDSGEIGGFDLWWLTKFATDRLPFFEFESAEQIEQSFEAAVAHGDLESSRHGLYYLAGIPRMLAIDIDSTIPGDALPSKNHDMVMTLYAHYFEAADLMRENFEKLDAKLEKRGKLSRNDEVQNRIYFLTWLGFLWSTCEGFTKKLNMHRLLANERPYDFKELLPESDALGKLIKAHFHALREVRNNVFHLRDNPDKIRKFLSKEAGRLSWALELHDALKRFFSNYRIQCTVHYSMNGRKGEIDIGRGRTRRTFST